MKAELAYQVAKELSSQELEKLFGMLQHDIATRYSSTKVKRKKATVLTNQEAINYLFKNVFKCNQ